ncbi:hypothetical protein [Microbacterium sp. MMO-113]|uniref:hypothetical protein n=1 Tax=Microbacterium sp. MMO-113 TaxID=3081273 RepID=UPI0030183C00
MSWIEVVLLLAGLVVLGASIVTVALRRRSELANDRKTARLLEHMATTVGELHAELSSRRSESDPRYREGLHAVAGRDYGSDESPAESARRVFHVQFATPMTTADSHSVIDLWDHLTRDADESDSYRAVLGSTLDDAIFHAAKVGVMDREQAEAFAYWAETTAAIIRPSRTKTVTNSHIRTLRSVPASA